MTTEAVIDLAGRFKSAFRQHPAGVAIVTAVGPEGPAGLTLSSLASVSSVPAMLSFSVTAASISADTVLSAATIAISLLHADHLAVAQSFAIRGAPRFTPEQGWTTRSTGEPILTTSAATLQCRIDRIIAVGGSRLVVAEVLDIDEGVKGAPLVYFDRGFHALDHSSQLA